MHTIYGFTLGQVRIVLACEQTVAVSTDDTFEVSMTFAET